MEEYSLAYPNVHYRRRVAPYELYRGCVVAFRYWGLEAQARTGVIIMEDQNMMLAAVNLYKEEGRIWVMDQIPDDIELFEASSDETKWGYEYFLDSLCHQPDAWKDENSYISFIDHESPQDDEEYKCAKFCMNFLSCVPRMLERTKWDKLKKLLTNALQQSGGLQFNRFRAEYYCFLIGVLMIAEHEETESGCLAQTDLFMEKWDQFSWMYGLGIGRVLGSRLHNFTSVINQTNLNKRKHYLHLYLPLAECYFDKIIAYNDDKPDKLRNAIDKAKRTEELEEQKTDLDQLFGILFPKHFQDIMSAVRPAATIAKMQQEMAAKEQRIKELENAVDDMTNRYNKVLEQLTDAVNAVESERISADELTAAFLRFPPELAFSFFGSMSTLLAMNPIWQKYAPIIQGKIFAMIENQRTRQQETEDHLRKMAAQPRNQYNVYPQAGSTANLGCEMKQPEFKVLAPSKEQQPALESRSATKGDACQSKNKDGDENV